MLIRFKGDLSLACSHPHPELGYTPSLRRSNYTSHTPCVIQRNLIQLVWSNFCYEISPFFAVQWHGQIYPGPRLYLFKGNTEDGTTLSLPSVPNWLSLTLSRIIGLVDHGNVCAADAVARITKPETQRHFLRIIILTETIIVLGSVGTDTKQSDIWSFRI
ncbi:hypothetical protein BS17DRAFT_784115 [Gyrodon lividus]|nr:hypothetical protein BS17DRAFT_784115 [Gyrodon lividus]